MKILSEITNKEYESVEKCLEDEVKFIEEQNALEAKRKEEISIKRERAHEVEEAYKVIEEANKKYIELRNKFIEDYGYFHMTYKNKSTDFNDIFDTIFNFW